jgi:hypothetical protein
MMRAECAVVGKKESSEASRLRRSPQTNGLYIGVAGSDIVSNRSRGVLLRKFNALWPNPERLEIEMGRVIAAQSKAATPVAWTFMSEIFTKHGRTRDWLSRYHNFRFDRVSWSCDGHECPSYIRSLPAIGNLQSCHFNS